MWMNLRFIHPHPARWLFMPYTSLSRALASYAYTSSSRALAIYALYIPRSSSRALAVFVLYILFSHLLSSSLSHPPPHVFSLTYYITHLLSGIFYPASSTTYRLSHIFYHVSSISHLPFRISHLHLHLSVWICIFRFAFRILHQTIHIQWVSHFILLFRICNLHTEYYNTSIGMPHSNPEQFASTAMQSARSRLLELPNEASIGLSPTT